MQFISLLSILVTSSIHVGVTNRNARVIASQNAGYDVDLSCELLHFINCKKSYYIRPFAIIPDSTNQIAALAFQMGLEDVTNKLEYDAAIQSMKRTTLPRRNSSYIMLFVEFLLFLGTGGGVATTERQNTSILWSLDDD